MIKLTRRWLRLHIPLLALLWSVAANCLADFSGQLTPQQAQARIEASSITVIDVRQPDEYAAGHVPGAINIPHDQIDQHLQQISTLKQKPVLLYCRSGRRAAMAEEALSKQGFTRLYHLQGDIQGWQASQLPVEH